jgi:hypothetical protein
MTEKHFGLIRSISLKILALQEHRAQEIQVKENSLRDLIKSSRISSDSTMIPSLSKSVHMFYIPVTLSV